MKKYQIIEKAGSHNHAGSKAVADVFCVAKRLGYQPMSVKMNTEKPGKLAKISRQIGFLKDYKACDKIIEGNSICLLQQPFHYPQLTRERTLEKWKEKNVKYISLIHDVEKLRAFRYNEYYKREFEFMLAHSDVFIVHNDKMLQYFLDLGVKEEQLINLQAFDYLQEGCAASPSFEKSITIAGNLDVQKCGYIAGLEGLRGMKIHLYGPNFSEEMKRCEHIQYHGSFPVDEIPQKLVSGFGLVWDGKGIEGCIGESGQYLRYNNPHKMSLYLSSGLPVVIWTGAAEADFVKKNGVGICVDSLLELPEIFDRMTERDYSSMVQAVQPIANKMRNGDYAEAALRCAEERLMRL